MFFTTVDVFVCAIRSFPVLNMIVMIAGAFKIFVFWKGLPLRCASSDYPFLGVEPLPNIRDGILVERLVKTMRYVADMRCCQYVVQRAEGVRRRQRLNVEYVDRGAGDLLLPQHADQSLLFDYRSARCIDQPGRWLHSLQLRGPYQT